MHRTNRIHRIHRIKCLFCLSLLLAACSPPATSTSTPVLDCRGNEPFWSLNLRHDHAQLQWVADDVRSQRFSGAWNANGSEWRGQAADTRLVAALQQQQCQDSMNDQTAAAGYAVSFELPGGSAASGCCWPGKP